MTPDPSPLSERRCEPCDGDTPRLEGDRVEALAAELDERWSVVDEHHLSAGFEFPDFVRALGFVNRAGAMAEREGHHPELVVTWGRVDVRIWTHAIDGLSENDFILAAKYDELIDD